MPLSCIPVSTLDPRTEEWDEEGSVKFGTAMEARELCRDIVGSLGSPREGTSKVLFVLLRESYAPVRFAMGSNVLLGVEEMTGAAQDEPREPDWAAWSATTTRNSLKMNSRRFA